MPNHAKLPIDSLLPRIVAALEHHSSLVIEAPPGAGKTTRVPPALLKMLPEGEVIVLEPRRIAARLAARRVASELGEHVGETVGYQVRFEEAIGPRTRLRFVTEGVLVRRLVSDPDLKGVTAVILDEFHERHLESDLALALMRRLQTRRPELRIIAMSATLDAAPVARYMNGCPILRSEGKLFELSISHRPYSPKPLESQLRDAFEILLQEQSHGDILAFLPGVVEIRRAMRECGPVAERSGLLVLPLHGSLSPEEQDRAIAPASKRKLILATNVAESSVTVEGISAVIDTGLARVASYSAWSGFPTLQVARVSKASAKQRAGRAGRTGPGRVLRLYTEEDYQHRPEQDAPEVLRTDLSQLCLDLRAMGIAHPHELEWLDQPPSTSIENAEALLNRLGVSEDMAKKLARYPLPPRLSRLLIEAIDRGVGDDGCRIAGLLSSGVRVAKNDLLAAVESDRDPRTSQHIEQLRRIARAPRQRHRDEDALLLSVLAGFPDRVARRRKGNQLLLSTGGSAEVEGESPHYEFMVAVDAEDRKEKTLPIIRITARIEPEWLIDLFPDHVQERDIVTWNRSAERVDAVSTLAYDNLVIQSHEGMPELEAAADLLAQKALEAGIERFVDPEELALLKARIEFSGLPAPNLQSALRELCMGLRSFAELKAATKNFPSILEQKIGKQRLNELAPARIRLPNGHQPKVHYEAGQTPWVASRLQDFFGLHETPRIGPDRTPLVVQLLAPNQRPVQTTTDLAGFWSRLYPQVRRELMRRYPKHKWPERP